MPQAVVDHFKVVEVDKQDGGLILFSPFCEFNRAAKAVEEQRPVWKAGQGVMKGIML